MANNELRIDEPQEEIAFDQPTGVELERDSESFTSDSMKPWDPAAIRVDPKTFSLKQVIDMIEDGDIQLAPDFQRLRVWNAVQKSQLIESILLRIPLPAFYFSSDEHGFLQVVDGMQRLSTINDFFHGKFKLTGLEYLQESLGNKTYKDLENFEGSLWARRIKTTQIFANVIDPQSPVQVKFDIFKRLNTGGTPLNSQEIRHCISGNRSRNFLKVLTSSEEFRDATGGKLINHIRMVDKELALRFCAFSRMEHISDYLSAGSLNGFLTNMTMALDSYLNESELAQLEAHFRNSMANASRLFGQYAFRKWFFNSDKVLPINKALFDAWSVGLSSYEWWQLEPKKEKIVQQARLLFEDDIFDKSISSTTDGAYQIKYRLSKVRMLLNEFLG